MAFSTLIAAATLQTHLAAPDWVVLDCRHDLMKPTFGIESYQLGHLPGAQFAALDSDLSDKSPAADGRFRGRHPLPQRAAFLETCRRWGIGPDTQVVAYDGQGGMYAARLWWMLRWIGHAHVAVLDGGLAAWQEQGGLLDSAVPSARPRGNIVETPALTKDVNVDQVLANVAATRDGGTARIVIDARAADRFRGENEIVDPVGGHIPGAKNRFFKDNLQADSRFKSAQDLQADFAALISHGEQAILQCGSGVTACHNLLAMEIAGLTGAALYPGSWSEWCADPSRPVARGSD